MKNTISTNIQTTDERMRFLRKSFGIAAIGFLAICLIGYVVSVSIDSSGIIKEALNSRKGRFNMSFYNSLASSKAVGKLAKISVLGIVLILVSGVLNIIWAFRFQKASKAFIYSAFAIYVAAQGIGFGILFLTWDARDLLAVFGIAGGIFLVMAAIGFLSKNLLPLGKWLFYGTIAAMAVGLVVMILYWTGLMSQQNKIMIFLWGFMGLLTIGWIAFDVWWIKRTAQFAQSIGGFDEETEFRLTMWFGFKLLSDFIALIWVVLRFFANSRS